MSQNVSCTDTIVFHEPSYPHLYSEATLARLIPGEFELVCAAELTTRLSPRSDMPRACRTLISLHGPYFPKEAWSAIRSFLEAGGNLVVFGGMPFTRPVRPDGTSEPEQQTYTDQLYLGPFFQLDVADARWYGRGGAGPRPSNEHNGGGVGGPRPSNEHNGRGVGGPRPSNEHNGGGVGGPRPSNEHNGGGVGGPRPSNEHNGRGVGGPRPSNEHNGGGVGGPRPSNEHNGRGVGGPRPLASGGPGGGQPRPYHTHEQTADLKLVAAESAAFLAHAPLSLTEEGNGKSDTFWSCYPKLCQASDHPEDMGSAGPLDTLLTPLLFACRESPYGTLRVATPAFLLDHQ